MKYILAGTFEGRVIIRIIKFGMHLHSFFLFSVPYYMNVEVIEYTMGKSITFKGESMFEPIFNMNVTSGIKHRSRLSLQIYWKRNSILFQVRAENLE